MCIHEAGLAHPARTFVRTATPPLNPSRACNAPFLQEHLVCLLQGIYIYKLSKEEFNTEQRDIIIIIVHSTITYLAI